MNNFNDCFQRIQTETKISNLSSLADLIGRRQPTVSGAKKRGAFPAEWALEIERKTGLLTRWIMTGEGPKRLDETQGNPQDSPPEPTKQTDSHDMPVYFTELVEWGREFAGAGNSLEWLENLLDSCLPAFKKWRDQKSGAVETAVHQNQVKEGGVMEGIWNWFWTEKGFKYICFYIVLLSLIIVGRERDSLKKENERLQKEIADLKKGN